MQGDRTEYLTCATRWGHSRRRQSRTNVGSATVGVAVGTGYCSGYESGAAFSEWSDSFGVLRHYPVTPGKSNRTASSLCMRKVSREASVSVASE